MKRTLFSFVLLSAALVFAGCNGTVSSVSFPAAAPWTDMATGILSPTDDLVAVASGAGVTAELAPGASLFPPFVGAQALVACGGATPHVEVCDDRACDAQVTCGADPVIEKRFVYTLLAHLDRGVFTSGGVQIQNGGGATQMGLSINAGNAGGSFDVAAGYSEGLIPGAQFAEAITPSTLDEIGAVALTPHWSAFGSGTLTGQVCSNGVCSTETIAGCDVNGDVDSLAYLTAAQPGTFTGTCGTIPVHLTINPPFATVGDCISGLKAQRCGGLKGQAKAACNHAQIGVCHATFNVPSSHNPS